MGKLKGFYSIRINDQWRIIFIWNVGSASEVEILNYHQNLKMSKPKNIHPGEIFLEEFLIPSNISAYKLAKDINIAQTRVSEIIKGNREDYSRYRIKT